jgi:glycosyltransferase involved in cell wall biosynthesis
MKVSVLITCFNHERYIRTAVESVLQQRTSFPFEIIACDDGSRDRSPEILKEIAAQHPDRLHLLLSETNLGQWGAEILMRGLKMCRGGYIALLDGDDYWTDPGKLHAQADFLDARPDCLFCFHNAEVRYDDGPRQPWSLYSSPLRETLEIEELFDVSSIHNSTVMFRAAIVDDYREWCSKMGADSLSDWAMGVIAARRGPVGYLDRVMSVYRQIQSGAWTQMGTAGQLEIVIRRCEQIDEFLHGQYHDAVERAICVRSYEAAGEYERLGDLRSAARHLSRALKGRPEWLEVHGYGLKGDELLAVLSKRLWAYRNPFLFRLVRMAKPLREELAWRRLKRAVTRQARRRLEKGMSIGSIIAAPNPAPAGARSAVLAATTLSWAALGTDRLEIRIGGPDGPVFANTDGPGTQVTGEWVQDGMLFYLQDVAGDLPPVFENTLDVVRVTVRESQVKIKTVSGAG